MESSQTLPPAPQRLQFPVQRAFRSSGHDKWLRVISLRPFFSCCQESLDRFMTNQWHDYLQPSLKKKKKPWWVDLHSESLSCLKGTSSIIHVLSRVKLWCGLGSEGRNIFLCKQCDATTSVLTTTQNRHFHSAGLSIHPGCIPFQSHVYYTCSTLYAREHFTCFRCVNRIEMTKTKTRTPLRSTSPPPPIFNWPETQICNHSRSYGSIWQLFRYWSCKLWICLSQK